MVSRTAGAPAGVVLADLNSKEPWCPALLVLPPVFLWRTSIVKNPWRPGVSVASSVVAPAAGAPAGVPLAELNSKELWCPVGLVGAPVGAPAAGAPAGVPLAVLNSTESSWLT